MVYLKMNDRNKRDLVFGQSVSNTQYEYANQS
jgi:hypothetical protein